MGDIDDMNATPIGKLPLPVMQSKNDGPRVDSSASYADILKDMRAPGGGGGGPVAAPQFAAPQFHQPVHHQPMQQPQFAPPQMEFQPEPPQRYQARRRRPRYVEEDDDYVDRGARARGLVARIKAYKSSILVAGIVFGVLWYVAPKLAQMVPQFVNPATGRFNVLGLVAIAFVSGGIHRLADTYIKP